MPENKRGYVPEGERCKGKSRQSGLPCKRRRSPGSGFCILHGGRSRKGAAHPNFKHGRHSRYRPPPKLLEDYGRFLRDPELAHHLNSVAIIDAMLQHHFDNWEDGGTPALWRELKGAWTRAEAAREAGDARGWGAAHEEVGRIIGRGAAQTGREGRVIRLMEQRRRHADSELKRETAEANTWTYEEAAAFYVALGDACKKHVHDPETLRRIENDLAAIVGRRSSRPAPEEPRPGAG